MSSRTPEECVELAADTAAAAEDRSDAINELKLANECDELAALVSNEDLGEEFRRQALEALGTDQCDSTLRRLAEDGSLNAQLQEAAEDLLDGLAGD